MLRLVYDIRNLGDQNEAVDVRLLTIMYCLFILRSECEVDSLQSSFHACSSSGALGVACLKAAGSMK